MAPTERSGQQFVIAEGERTGHAHTLPGDDRVALSRAGGPSEQAADYLSVRGAGVMLRHEEHRPLPISQGHYRIVRQREYDPAGAESRWTHIAD